ncbi:MAG: hypothetical protein KAS32_20900 [Candidatus Peribacteraceae bacterium]|nr:hypothetical protein [Candidatus Peribacteraceae bacterium]
MSIPENPNTMVIQNVFYPGGLTEGQVWKHYQKYKTQIVKEINKRPVMFFIYRELNEKPIIKRKLYNSPIVLVPGNYDRFITGRTVSIAVEQLDRTKELIIDIDPGPSATENEIKQCVENVLKSSVSKLPTVINHRVISTSKGFHVYFILKTAMNINSARVILIKLLTMDFGNKYTINKKSPSGSIIDLDLTPTTHRGVHQVPFALTRNGLVSMDVTKNLNSFNRRSAIIK